MPNHCYQQVEVRGPETIIRKLFDNLTKADPEFCAVVVPQSEEDSGSDDVEMGDYTVPRWYRWRLDNWNTKWDVVDVDITNPLLWDCMSDTWSFTFNCWTAWSPPIAVWEKLKERGVYVNADYQDEGYMFEGRWTDGVDECWEPEVEEEGEYA